MWKFTNFLLFVTIFSIRFANFSHRTIRHGRQCAHFVFEEKKAQRFIEIINEASEKDENKLQEAEWNYATNLTDENLKKKTIVISEMAERSRKRWMKLMRFRWKTFRNFTLKRQFQQYSVLGSYILPREDLTKYTKLVSDMEKTFATNKICDFKDKTKCNLTLDEDIVKILEISRNESELKHIWISWRNGTRIVKNSYIQYVCLANKIARMNNFSNNAELWLYHYEDCHIKRKFQFLWEQIKPLYLQIHAYTRYHLRKIYGNDIIDERGTIPAHLFGNLWAQSWENIAADMLPFPTKNISNITENLIQLNYTARKIFETAENFFKSINMSSMPPLFWENSIIERPKNREIICHGSAWDFSNRKDFRIKMCTTISEQDFLVAHHEMGHIEYYIQYKNQPFPFRDGANPGFHEAIGDLIALSVKSPKHLNKLGFSSNNLDDPETNLNNLFLMAMTKIVFLPFAYLVDLWRWDVFSGRIRAKEYNRKWWHLRRKLQGIKPPTQRNEDDFDPASKYHIISDTPYIRYFVSFIIQFQFHKGLCIVSKEYDDSKPLHLCDIYQKPEAGNLLKKMLELGSSKPWPEALKMITGSKEMDAGPLLEYFKPLHVWLEKENEKNGAFIGW